MENLITFFYDWTLTRLGHVFVGWDKSETDVFMLNVEMCPLKLVSFLWPNRKQIHAGFISILSVP